MNRKPSPTLVLKGLAVLAATLVIAGCASTQRRALGRATASSAGALASGDYERALDLYQKLYEEDRADGKVVSNYASVIEEVKAAGDDAANKGSYASAQAVYRILASRWDGFSALGRRLSFKKPDLEAAWKDCRLALCERQFRQEVGAGNFAKALAVYQSVRRDYPEDAAVKSLYLHGASEIASMAETALAAGDYALAGRTGGALLKSADSFVTAAAGAAVEGRPGGDALAQMVRTCALELTSSGFVEYRKGNLESAIACWDGLLTFDPDNAEIKKAVETARAQLAKSKGSGKGGGSRGSVAKGGRGGRPPLI
jgi:tetratricopeptide (TPR) repeat protein